ncbi:hypothetical protein U8260_31670 [Nocardia sp. CDC192]|nr:hypothetical protein [Nocardia sp. CDC186]MBF6196176.1 hypothetical protein [Nocardia beijingensis]MEA3532814.1 hypothetical protein [Nocardia sp. CDC192]
MLSTREFQAFIDAIGAQCRAGMEAVAAGHDAPPAYQLPGYLTRAQLDQIPSPVLQVLDTYSRRPTEDQLADNVATVAPAAERCADGGMSPTDFTNLVDQQIEENLSRFHQAMDVLVTNLEVLGQQHQDWREVIMQVFSAVSDFETGLWQQATTYLYKLGQDPRNLYRGVASTFGGFEQQVGNFFANLEDG